MPEGPTLDSAFFRLYVAPPMSLEFLLIRHAQSEWNAVGRWQGHGDPPLSAEGRRQAARVAAELHGTDLDLVVASDLRRARETALAVVADRGIPIEYDVGLRELDVGRWTGLTREQIEQVDRAGLEAFEKGGPEIRPGGGESRLEIRARTRERIAALARRRQMTRIAVVTHLGAIRALVPGAEPANAEVLRIAADELLRARPAAIGVSSAPL